MRRLLFVFASLAFAVLFCGVTSQAQAQATRTWVSGLGDDANPCSRTAPCKTFPGAFSKTADCGEIDALDPAGYGTITITKGIKIDGGGGEVGQVASILASLTPGITVNNTSATCPMDVIRNLDINGIASGTVGINVLAGGTLAIENVDVENFTQQCLHVAPTVAVGITAYNANFERCATGGLVINYTGSGFERVVMSGVKFSKMTSSGVGVSVTGNAKVSMRACDVNNDAGGGVLVSGAGASVELQGCTVSNNQVFGIHTTSGGTALLAENAVTYNNGTGLLADAGSNILTWSNNFVSGNSPDGSRTGTIVPQ